MKTSVILMLLLVINTTVLFAEIISILTRELNSWSLIGIEVLLLLGYYKKSVLTDFLKTYKTGMNNLNLFVRKGKKSA